MVWSSLWRWGVGWGRGWWRGELWLIVRTGWVRCAAGEVEERVVKVAKNGSSEDVQLCLGAVGGEGAGRNGIELFS